MNTCPECGEPTAEYGDVTLHVRTQEPGCGLTVPPSEPDLTGISESL